MRKWPCHKQIQDARERYLREDFDLEALEWAVGWALKNATPTELMRFDRRRYGKPKRFRGYSKHGCHGIR
jgi:hypothetical protein